MTVEELIKALQDGCDQGRWNSKTRVTYMDYRWLEGPCNLATLEVKPVLQAAEDDASIIFPIDDPDPTALEFINAVSQDCESTLEKLKKETEYCLLLRPAGRA